MPPLPIADRFRILLIAQESMEELYSYRLSELRGQLAKQKREDNQTLRAFLDDLQETHVRRSELLNAQKQLAQVEHDRDQLLDVLLNGLPPALDVRSYLRCQTIEQLRVWEKDFFQRVLAAVEIIPQDKGGGVPGYSSPRAWCPLCERGSNASYTSGFAVPIGLERHLFGWGSNWQCTVYHALYQDALRWVRSHEPGGTRHHRLQMA